MHAKQHPTKSGYIQITSKCPFCPKVTIVDVREDDFLKWQGGTLVQKAFPTLTLDEREALITGICPACFPKEEPEMLDITGLRSDDK